MKPHNKEKAKILLGRLNSLQNSTFPDVKSLSDEIINKEYANVADSVKSNSTIKMLDAINAKLEAFKVDFDLKPIASSIQDFQDELSNLKEENSTQFGQVTSNMSSKIEEINKLIQQAKQESVDTTNTSVSPLWEKIHSLQSELGALSARKIEIPDFGSQITTTEKKLQKLITSLKTEVQGNDKSEGLQKQITGFQDELKKLRTDLMSRLAGLGGGNMNRQINVNSSVMSLKFNDINFSNSGGIAWSASDDTTNKRVNITASIIASGGGGTGSPGGLDTQIQFNDGGNFGGASVLTWNKNSSVLALSGTEVITNAGTANALSIVQNGNTSASISVGGAENINNTNNTGSGLVIYSNHGAGQVGRQLVVYTQSSVMTADTVLFQSDATNNTSLNVKGVPTNKGVVKVEHLGNTAGDSNGSAISIALGNGVNPTSVQGIFLDAPTVKTDGKLLNIRNAGSDKLVLSGAGALTLNGAYTFPTADGTTNFALVTNGSGQLSFASVAGVGGSGITRTSSIISASGTAGSTALTDYVYFASTGLKLTLPTAVGNKNLYTVKNVSVSSVLVDTTSAQTIDGSSTALMPVANQSIDFISDNSNWNVI